MPKQFKFSVWAGAMIVVLSSCATPDPANDFKFDYSSAAISDFNGVWKGRVDCGYANGYTPLSWIKVVDGRGEFGFGNRLAGASSTLGSIYADLDLASGQIKWKGDVKAWWGGEKLSVSFSGYWMDKTFQLKGKIAKSRCSGLNSKSEQSVDF